MLIDNRQRLAATMIIVQLLRIMIFHLFECPFSRFLYESLIINNEISWTGKFKYRDQCPDPFDNVKVPVYHIKSLRK